jgi:mRNA interferase MazF
MESKRMKATEPLRGQVWMADLDPTKDHEQAGKRPVLVVSADVFNAGPADLVVVLPITSKAKGIPTHVAVSPPEGGLPLPAL